MSNKAPVALAIGVGYLLGRTHKMRWAIILGTAAATGRLNGLSGQLVQQATKTIGASPELSKLGTSAQRLLDAGRSAAMSALSSRVESASGVLQDRLGGLGGGLGGADESEDGDQKDGRRSEGSRGRTDEPEDEYDEDEEADDEADDEDDYTEDDLADEPTDKDDEEADGGRKPAVVRKGRR